MRIYTRTGDKGETSLFGGKRVPKNHLRIAAYGSIDELNSLLGVVVAKIQDVRFEGYINLIQKDLFLIGSHLAGAKINLNVLPKKVEEIEGIIDNLTYELPELHNFILPEGTETASFLFLARAVTRRAERELVSLLTIEEFDERILVYLNRLSDFLFVLARYINFKEGLKETVWKAE